jgi:hypothetical protein
VTSERENLLRNNLLLLLVGFFAGLWFSERQKTHQMRDLLRTAAPPSRKDRTLEQLSPMYAANTHPLKSIHAINPDDLSTYVHGIMKELVRPDLTPLEAKLVRDYIGITMLQSTSYDSHHKEYVEKRANQWLQEIIEESQAQLAEQEESPDADDQVLD